MAPMSTSSVATRSQRPDLEHALPLQPRHRLVDDAGANASESTRGCGRLLPADEQALRLRRLGPRSAAGHRRDADLRHRKRQWSAGRPCRTPRRRWLAATTPATARSTCRRLQHGIICPRHRPDVGHSTGHGHVHADRATHPHGSRRRRLGILNGHLSCAGRPRFQQHHPDLTYDYDIAANTWTQRANMPTPNNVAGQRDLPGQALGDRRRQSVHGSGRLPSRLALLQAGHDQPGRDLRSGLE